VTTTRGRCQRRCGVNQSLVVEHTRRLRLDGAEGRPRRDARRPGHEGVARGGGARPEIRCGRGGTLVTEEQPSGVVASCGGGRGAAARHRHGAAGQACIGVQQPAS
jgi:hypothetical protein